MRPRATSIAVCFALFALVGVAADLIVFGPETFTRAPGRPRTVTRTFQVKKPKGTYLLRVVNHGVTSATIELNGRTVLEPEDFRKKKDKRWHDRDGRGGNDNDRGRDDDDRWRDGDRGDDDDRDHDPVPSLERRVKLRDGKNTLEVELRSRLGTSLTLQIVSPDAAPPPDTTPPSITASATPSPNGNGWNNTNVTVSFACTDASGIATCPAPVTVTAEGANQVVTGTATDNAGNSASTSITLNIDKTAPTASTAQAPPPNENGWNNSPVTVHFDCTDGLSGIATCPPDPTVAADGANQTVAAVVADRAGNTATIASAPFNIDRANPVVTVSLSPAPGAGGFYDTAVTAHFACSDDGSGVSSCPEDQIVSTEGAAQTVTGTAADRAGNTATATSQAFNVDLSAPTITVQLTPAPNAEGWNNTPVTARFTCEDAVGGVATCPPDQHITTDGANQLVAGTATDRAGHTATASARVSIDTTPPVVNFTSPPNGSFVFAPAVTAFGTATDALSGLSTVTCDRTPATVIGSDVTCALTLVRGPNAITAVATDRAGNSQSFPLGLNYRRVPNITITSPQNLSFHNITPTTVTGSVDDATAVVTINSIPATNVDGTFSIPLPLAEGPNIVTASASTDHGAAGTASIEVTLDTTPPRVTIVSPPDNFETTDERVSVTGNVNDIVVGTVNDEEARVTVNAATAVVANRTFLAADVPLVLGPNVIQAIGTDRVGNSFTVQITVIRKVPTEPQIRVISGNNQTGPIRGTLPESLVVSLADALGAAVPNKPVIFKVLQNDGTLTGAGVTAPTVIVNTDDRGQASASWRLGDRAGAGGNTVEAYSVGFEGTALFAATGTQGAAGTIVVDTGNDQAGSVNQPLPKPFIAVVVDTGNNRVAGIPVRFTVRQGGGSFNGEQSYTVVSDSDGRVAATLTLGPHEGNANNVVEASFESNTRSPASFTASGRMPGDPAQTTISGVVLDNSNTPIPGVTVRAVLTSVLRSNVTSVQAALAVQTDAEGQFVIPQAPVGLVKLLVEGSTAELPGAFPSLEYDMVTVAGRDNTVGQPIFLLPLNEANQLCVTATSGGGTLTIPEAPGFSLTFEPGQVTFPGGAKTGCVSVTVVHGDKVPMVPGFGQQPRFIVTIQPAGAVFNPPAPITLPNVDGLKPRAVTEMYSFDHDIGSFVAIGTGTVSEDGLIVRSSPGVGVLKAGWHCGGDPTQTGSAASISVSISPTETTKEASETADFTATGNPPQDGAYSWALMATETGDDATAASLTASPSCANQPTCTATIKGEKPGTLTLRVTFTCTTTGAVTTADARITITVKTMLKEVTYSGAAFHDVARDRDGTNYPAPQWRDANDNGTATDSGDNRFPISYMRNGTVTLAAVFKLSHAVTNASAKITGEGNGLRFENTVTGISGTTFTMPATTSTGNLPNTIKKMDPSQIQWKVSFDAGNSYPASSFKEAGASDNVVHVTLGNPITTPLYETVLDIGTRNADGRSAAADAVSAIWGDFRSLDVRRADGVTMRYWNPVLGVCQSIDIMLADAVANGSCIAWSQMLNRTLKAQGIAGSQIYEIQADTVVNPGADGFLVKHWNFGLHIRTGPNGVRNSAVAGDDVAMAIPGADQPAIGPGPNGVLNSVAAGDDTTQDGYFIGMRYPYFTPPPQGDAVEQPGIAGQFNPNPPEAFLNHFVVKYGGQVYDPSYGAGPFASELAHENAAIDGISSGQRAKKNGPAQELRYTGRGIE